MPKIFLIADSHMGHTKMLEYCNRPTNFEDKILKGLRTIDSKSILIHLGDFCIGNDKKWHKEFFNHSNARRHILVRGNHDMSKSDNWYYNHGWDFVCKTFTGKYFGKKILFSHKPLMRLTHDNYDINVHGHFHNTDHRSHELKLRLIRNKHQKLLAIENTDYKPVPLKAFLGL